MSSDAIQDSVIELGWSLWTELGVPGVSRHHALTVIDAEPLIVVTPTLAAGEPRLMEQAFGWCVAHSDRISASRLKGLLSGSPRPVVSRFSAFAKALRSHGVRWPVTVEPTPWSPPARPPSARLPLERPSLLRFRVRALCGVGARADVLCELLTSSDLWQSAAELARLGYTKRNIARLLSELDDAGLVSSHKVGNALRYRLLRPESLDELAGSGGLTAPPWQPILGLVLDLLGLLHFEGSSADVRRVEANKLRERLVQPSRLLDLGTPPPTRGVPSAWDVLLAWGTEQADAIAAGTAPILGPGR